ncbi:MAG: hypothetical protein L6Q54_11090 [Leptospiraceae bacterium]|nr:tetratricopeptide repeat protein [Leptospiraceae bacterium]MCK6381773.1 hypothetical protein [Leptospiraceae bacterium]NUM40615.1 tetratricopeptide repeat protein [Leptospiraceae bacterium]
MNLYFKNFKPNYLKIGIGLLSLVILSNALYSKNDDPLHYFKNGEKQFKKGNFKEAYTDYENFIKESPYEYEVRDALFKMGKIKFDEKSYPDTITLYERLLKNYKTIKYTSELKILLGRSYFQMNLLQKSSDIFLDYVKNNKKPHELLFTARFFLGKIEAKRKKGKDALQHFKYAVSIAKGIQIVEKEILDECYFLTSKYSYQEGNTPDAYKYFHLLSENYFSVNPEHKRLIKQIMNSAITESNGLPEETVTSIKFDNDDIWIGTFISGLVRYTRSSGKFVVFTTEDGLLSNEVRDILIDGDYVWVSTLEGVTRFTKKDSKFKTYFKNSSDKNFRLQRVYQDDRYLYFGSLGGGVKKYDKINQEMTVLGESSPLKSDLVPSIHGDDNRIVFSTLGAGVVLYDKKSNTYKSFTKENGLSGNDVRDAILDGRFIWAGIHGKGLNKIDIETGKVEFLGNDEKLNLTYPVCIAKRGSEIWVGTVDGGLRIFRQEKNEWEKYTVVNGLISNDINHIEFEGDYVWVGTLNKGISIIYYPSKNKF